MGIDETIFVAFTHCRYKAFLKNLGTTGDPVEYEILRVEADLKYKAEAVDRLLRRIGGVVARQPISLTVAVADGNELILGAQVESLGMALTFDVIERSPNRSGDRQPYYVPVLFYQTASISKVDSMLASLHGIILSEAIGLPVPFAKVVHGSKFSETKIKLHGPSGPTRLAVEARRALDGVKRQIESATAPTMTLNSHCPECEFRERCRAEAVGRDDLSLLRGMSEKEILTQRRRGINTVTQFAFTFRPKAVGKKTNRPLKKHLHALQAMAIRDKKVYLLRTPNLPAKPTRVYLDVEGLADRDFYYLVGVVVDRGAG